MSEVPSRKDRVCEVCGKLVEGKGWVIYHVRLDAFVCCGTDQLVKGEDISMHTVFFCPAEDE